MTLPKNIQKSETEETSMRLAVLIDADNAQAAVIEGLLAEVARFGEATVKRIYGDFTSPTSSAWKKVLQRFAIKPVQQFAYTTGKNATDSTVIIDAMDLLYTRKFDGFCLVTSDSDFTGLAMRIREEGLTVLGFGEKKTPDAFRNACHRFIFTEVLRQSTEQEKSSDKKAEASAAKAKQPPEKAKTVSANAKAEAKPETKPETAKKETIPFPAHFILDALDHTDDDSGWASLSAFGSYLNKLQPDFDPRNFGYKKLSDLVKAKTDLFEVDERKTPAGNKQIYLRARKTN